MSFSLVDGLVGLVDLLESSGTTKIHTYKKIKSIIVGNLGQATGLDLEENLKARKLYK